MAKHKVVIEVLGGVASVEECPDDVEVEIKDHDIEQVAEIYLVKGFSWLCPGFDCDEVNDEETYDLDEVTCNRCGETFPATYIG